MLQTNILFGKDGMPQTLQICWFEYQPFMQLNMEEILFTIIDQVKALHIKNILLDPSTRRSYPPAEDMIAFFELFLSGLSDTSLEKFARISVEDPETEYQFRAIIDQIKKNLNVRFSLAYFNAPEEARSWFAQ